MKRLTHDVRRWYCYLFRRELGLPIADPLDDDRSRLADEVFCRLYAPDDMPVASDASAADKGRAAALHGAVDAVAGDMKQLQKLCKRDLRRAAHATKEIVEKAWPKSEDAADASGSSNARDALDGLDGTDMAGGSGWGGSWKGESEANERAKSLAERIKDDERLKRIAALAGKFKRIATTQKKVKVRRSVGELTDVIQGDSLERLLPSELARFASASRLRRLAVLRDYTERRLLEYEMVGEELLGRGPLVLCIDKSGSMTGDKDVWATAVALALLEKVHREHRTFILLGFNDSVFQRVVVKPGMAFPQRELLAPCSGGTDIEKVLNLSLHAVETRSKMRKADIILVTDGQSYDGRAPDIRARAAKHGVKILGVGINVGEDALQPWCDETHCIEDVSGLDDATAEKLFT